MNSPIKNCQPSAYNCITPACEGPSLINHKFSSLFLDRKKELSVLEGDLEMSLRNTCACHDCRSCDS